MPSTDHHHQKSVAVANDIVKDGVDYRILSNTIVNKLRINIKVQRNTLSTEIYSIYCSRAWGNLSDFAEKRQEGLKTYINCGKQFQWCHRPIFPLAQPTPFGGRHPSGSIWIPLCLVGQTGDGDIVIGHRPG